MKLIEKLKNLFPELSDNDFLEYITLQNDLDGRGDYIAKWNHPTIQQPSEELLK
jgi:hypothetical protein